MAVSYAEARTRMYAATSNGGSFMVGIDQTGLPRKLSLASCLGLRSHSSFSSGTGGWKTFQIVGVASQLATYQGKVMGSAVYFEGACAV